MTSTKFNQKSYAERVGNITGRLMGKHCENADVAMLAIEMLARGEINQFLTTVPEAVRVRVQSLMAPQGKPFALDARELHEMAAAAKEGFNAAGKAKEKAKTASTQKLEKRPPHPAMAMTS